MHSVQQRRFSWSVMQINCVDFVPENAPSYQLITAYRTSLTTSSSPYVNLPPCSFHQRWGFHERVKLFFGRVFLPLIILLKENRVFGCLCKREDYLAMKSSTCKTGEIFITLLPFAVRREQNPNKHFSSSSGLYRPVCCTLPILSLPSLKSNCVFFCV